MFFYDSITMQPNRLNDLLPVFCNCTESNSFQITTSLTFRVHYLFFNESSAYITSQRFLKRKRVFCPLFGCRPQCILSYIKLTYSHLYLLQIFHCLGRAVGVKPPDLCCIGVENRISPQETETSSVYVEDIYSESEVEQKTKEFAIDTTTHTSSLYPQMKQIVEFLHRAEKAENIRVQWMFIAAVLDRLFLLALMLFVIGLAGTMIFANLQTTQFEELVVPTMPSWSIWFLDISGKHLL